MTDEPRTLVREQLNRYAQGGRADPSLILSDDVAEAAAELWRSAVQQSPGGAVPFEVVWTLAGFHWNRHDALSGGIDLYDLQVAAVMFGHIFKVDPELVPGQLRELVADELDVMEIQSEMGPPTWWAVERDYLGATHGGLLNHNVRTGPDWLFREASAIMRQAGKGDAADLDRAISLLRSAVSATPHDHPYRTSALSSLIKALGLRATRAEDPAHQDEAVDVARAAVAEYPVNPVMLDRLAVALSDRGRTSGDLTDLADAVAASRAAVEMASEEDPNQVAFLANLALVLGNRYDYSKNPADRDALMEAYQAAADAVPNDDPRRADILAKLSRARQLQVAESFNHGVELEKQGDLEGAEAAFRQAAAFSDTEAAPLAAYNLGILLKRRGDREGAEAAFRQASASGDADLAPVAAFDLGILLKRRGATKEAKAAFQSAIDSGHTDAAPRAAFNLGVILEEQGDVDGAEAAFRQASASGHGEAAFSLGNLLMQQGATEGAEAAFRQAIGSGNAEAAAAAAAAV